ncbi:MAG: peptidylprolyl isomerase [Leptolyngbya sp. SIO1D8]|nr:peptidylprolyl isomerase [Leptolyngbya sp. SIO1D8]
MTNLSGISVTTQEMMDFLRCDLRMKEICTRIISQRIIENAAEEAEIIVQPEEVQAELERIRYEKRFDHPSQLLSWISDQMATLSDVENRIRKKILTRKLARHLFLEHIQDRFLHSRNDFEQIKLYKIVVPYETLAREIFYQVEEEEISFFEAAHIYDIDESRRLICGYDGKRLRTQISPDIAPSLLDAQVGEVIGPIQQAADRFMLLLIDDLLIPELTPEITEILIEQMFQEWLDEKILVYINSPESE